MPQEIIFFFSFFVCFFSLYAFAFNEEFIIILTLFIAFLSLFLNLRYFLLIFFNNIIINFLFLNLQYFFSLYLLLSSLFHKEKLFSFFIYIQYFITFYNVFIMMSFNKSYIFNYLKFFSFFKSEI
jgi:hypothetical protein